MSFVRVRLPNGYETSLNEDFARSEGLRVLDEPAIDYRGWPLPATRKNGRRIKPRTTVQQEVAKRAASAPLGVPVASSTTATTGGDAEGGNPA